MTNRKQIPHSLVLLLLLQLSFQGFSARVGADGGSSLDPINKYSSEGKVVLTPWSENVFNQIEKEYGIESGKRMRYVYDLMQTNQQKSVREKLEIVNTALNLFPWLSDKELWNEDDYWATPLETLARFGGDCEDMAIGKFVMLRLMGIPKKNLYLGYVNIRQSGQPHMVLVWLNDDRTESLVLDHLDKEIKSGKDRKDLQAIYLFDADQKVILLNDENGERSIKSEIGKRKMSKLESIKRRIIENNEKYKQYNDGRPLWLN
ncbi:MAG: transglutaminase-like cysteine peptidase [Methylomicrobium sp.]